MNPYIGQAFGALGTSRPQPPPRGGNLYEDPGYEYNFEGHRKPGSEDLEVIQAELASLADEQAKQLEEMLKKVKNHLPFQEKPPSWQGKGKRVLRTSSQTSPAPSYPSFEEATSESFRTPQGSKEAESTPVSLTAETKKPMSSLQKVSEEVIGKNIWKYTYPEDRIKIQALVQGDKRITLAYYAEQNQLQAGDCKGSNLHVYGSPQTLQYFSPWMQTMSHGLDMKYTFMPSVNSDEPSDQSKLREVLQEQKTLPIEALAIINSSTPRTQDQIKPFLPYLQKYERFYILLVKTVLFQLELDWIEATNFGGIFQYNRKGGPENQNVQLEPIPEEYRNIIYKEVFPQADRLRQEMEVRRPVSFTSHEEEESQFTKLAQFIFKRPQSPKEKAWEGEIKGIIPPHLRFRDETLNLVSLNALEQELVISFL